MSKIFQVFFLAAQLLFASLALAEGSVQVSVNSSADNVEISVQNSSQVSVSNVDAALELDAKQYSELIASVLAPGQRVTKSVPVAVPDTRGGYPVIVKVSYDLGKLRRQAANVGLFQNKGGAPVAESVALRDIAIRCQAVVDVPLPVNGTVRLVVPDELEAKPIDGPKGVMRFLLTNHLTQLSSVYSMYAVVESYPGGELHQTSITPARVATHAIEMADSMFSTLALEFICIGALIFCALNFIRFASGKSSRFVVALVRWSLSLFIVSGLFLIARTAHVLPDNLLAFHHIGRGLADRGYPYFGLVVTSVIERLYFDGIDYDYFFQYLADPLLIYCLSLNLLVIFYWVKPNPDTDKNWHLMLSFFSIVPGMRRFVPGACAYWSKQSKVALLAILVKAFYVPLMCSWTINNIFHQANLNLKVELTFSSINEYVVAFLIFLDVAVFCLGYLVELPQLRNQIRSVEPTLLGWVVCFMCYPPFNKFSMVPFDHKLFASWGPFGNGVQVAGLVAITLLWAIYTWASIALGWKASNLTNRGIVATGPYKFVRHPAYVSKVTLWGVGGLTAGSMGLCMFVTSAIVYGLRAWTEERHLSADPDYLEYKQRVPWAIIPGVW